MWCIWIKTHTGEQQLNATQFLNLCLFVCLFPRCLSAFLVPPAFFRSSNPSCILRFTSCSQDRRRVWVFTVTHTFFKTFFYKYSFAVLYVIPKKKKKKVSSFCSRMPVLEIMLTLYWINYVLIWKKLKFLLCKWENIFFCSRIFFSTVQSWPCDLDIEKKAEQNQGTPVKCF